MNRTDVIDRLRQEAPTIRALGGTALWLFGSTARDQARLESDVDLLVDYDERFSLIELIRLRDHLSAILGSPVDLTTRRALHPLLRDGIEREAVRVV